MKKLFCIIIVMMLTILSASISFAAQQVINGQDANYGAGGTTPAADGARFSSNNALSTTADGQNFGSAPSIVVDTTNTGTLNIIGTSTISGDIGDGTHSLATLNANGGAGKTVALQGTAYITNLNFGGDGTVTAANGEDLTAAVTTSANNTGTLSVGGGAVLQTITGQVGTNSARLKEVLADGANMASVRFTETVYATTMTVSGNASILLGKGFTGTTMHFAEEINVSTEADQYINATLTTNANNTGSFSSDFTDTVSGQIGTSSKKFDEVTGGATGKTSTFSGDVFARTMSVVGDGTVALNGNFTGTTLRYYVNGTVNVADGKNISAVVKNESLTALDNQGTLTFLGSSSTGGQIGEAGGKSLLAVNINGGNVTLNDNIYAQTTTINTGGTLTLSANKTITGATTLAGTGILDVANHALTDSGTYTQGSGTTLKVTANSSTDFGKVTATTATVNAGSSINVTVGGYIPNNTAFNSVISGAGVTAPNTITSSNPIFTFAGSVSGNDLNLTATRANTYNSLATNSNASAAGSVLNSIATSGTPSADMTTVLGALDSLTSGDQITAALSSLTPPVDNSTSQTSRATLDNFVSTVVNHLESLRPVATGISTGDASADNGVWLQGFGSYLHQSPQGLSVGYNAYVWGTAVGYDKLINDDLRLGASFGYANDSVNSEDNSTHTDADSYQGTLYASFTRGLNYVDGALSFAYNAYNGLRNIIFPGINRTANSDYDGQQYSLYLEGGHTFKKGKFELTPLVSIKYEHLRLGSYTEKDAGDLNLTVDSQDYDTVQTGLGAKIAYPIQGKYSTFVPEFHLRWLYDVIGDNQQSTSTFTGGGASFDTSGFRPARSSCNLGTKFTLINKQNVEFSLNYDFQVKDDFYGHSGYMNVRHTF